MKELCNENGGYNSYRPYNQTGGMPDLPHNEETPIADTPARTLHSFILWSSRKRYPGTFKMVLTMAGGLLAETAAVLFIYNYNPMKQKRSTLDRLDGPQVDENRVDSAHLSWSSFNMLLASLWDPARRSDVASWMVRIRLSLAVVEILARGRMTKTDFCPLATGEISSRSRARGLCYFLRRSFLILGLPDATNPASSVSKSLCP